MHPLDASKELQDWFAEVRLRLPNNIRIEWWQPKLDAPYVNYALVGLYADSNKHLENMLCTLAVTGRDSMDMTIAIPSGVVDSEGRITAYGCVEYIVHTKKDKKGIRCKVAIVSDHSHLRATLDEYFNDFIEIVRQLP